ncbi:MAG TPA: hypothetical protein DCM68_05770 [Verrucomicrobia bacterium]|nr:hypothetical protein [Verrucomicrobiota bacterium]
MIGLALLALPLAFCGCESDDTDTDISATRFNVDSELRNYSDTDEYTWDTTLDRAVVVVRIDDFTEGDVGVRVYDGAGELIFVAALNTLNSAYYNGDDFFFQRQTDQGVAGLWRIVLDYNDLTGNFDLTLE